MSTCLREQPPEAGWPLRAEIDEPHDTLYSTVSGPFAPPKTGKIAVNVVNHFGDEV